MNRMRQEIKAAAVGAVRQGEKGDEQDFLFTPEFSGFAGHFPGYPVFPAVLQMLIAQCLAEQILGHSLTGLVVERAKFMSQLMPEDRLTVRVKPKAVAGGWQINAELSTPEATVSRFTMIFRDGREQ